MVKFSQIKSIKKIGVEKTYDLEVKKNHNFISNGIITHNSHSEAYGLLGVIQGYYKANYPIEFYTGMLQTLGQVSGKVVGTDKDKVYNLLKDYKAHGFKLLFPDINKSNITFKIDKDPKTGDDAIRVGFNYLKGIGPKQAIELAKKQPYRDYYDFLDRVDRRTINSKIVQICKDIGLFNTVGGAPNINQKLLPEINYIELTKEISKQLKEIGWIIFNNKEKEQLEIEKDKKSKEELKKEEELKKQLTLQVDGNSENEIDKLEVDSEEIEGDQIILNLYKMMNIKEDKYPETDLSSFGIVEFKKVMTKLKSQLKGLNDRITKEKFGYETIDKNEIEKIEKVRTFIDLQLKRLISDFKLIKKGGKNGSSNFKIEEIISGEELFKTLEPSQLNYKVFTKIFEGKTFLEIEEELGISQSQIEIIYAYKFIESIDFKINELIGNIIKSLNVDKTCVVMNPSVKYMIKACSILVNVDLTEYAPLVPLMNKFMPLKFITFTEEIQYSTTIGVIMDKIVLPDQKKEDGSINYNKTKVRGNIMIGDIKKPLFINGRTYLKFSEILDNLQDGDPIIIRFKVSPGFPMIAVQEILEGKNFLEKINTRQRLDEIEQKFVKQ